MSKFTSLDTTALASVVGGDGPANNKASASVGIQYNGANATKVNVGGSLEEQKNDYRSCLDAIGKYGGKVSECASIHDKSKG
ncbi:MAG: hypothetical protein AB7P03_11110 [Kofleriaceae bacterium]